MSLQRVLIALLALFTASVGLVAAGGSAQAVTWTKVDRVCKTNAAGTVCATTWKSDSQWRGTVAVTPHDGEWFKVTAAGWSEAVYGQAFCDDSYPDFPACPASSSVARTFSWVVSGTTGVLGAHVDSSAGELRFAVGRSGWHLRGTNKCTTIAQGKICVAISLQADRDKFYRRARTTLTPSSGASLKPLDVRLTTRASADCEGTLTSKSLTTTFDGLNETAAWSGVSARLLQPAPCAVSSTAVFHYVAGGVTQALSNTAAG